MGWLEMPLPPADDLFSTQTERDGADLEKIVNIPLSQIDPFPNHPFRVVIDDEMQAMAESVKAVGVQTPATVRKKANGRYEMISGHRRQLASELAGLHTLPCIIRKMSTDDAIISMVDSNHQRETILPSEKAWSYKMKLDAMKRQGKRTDLTSRQVGRKSESADEIGELSGDSGRQVYRYIRLTDLVPQLLSLVDEGKIAITPAVELSYLSPEQQNVLFDVIGYEERTPSQAQAAEMRKLSNEGSLTDEAIHSIMREERINTAAHYKIPYKQIYRFFPEGTSQQTVEDTIIKALELWHKTKQ